MVTLLFGAYMCVQLMHNITHRCRVLRPYIGEYRNMWWSTSIHGSGLVKWDIFITSYSQFMKSSPDHFQ